MDWTNNSIYPGVVYTQSLLRDAKIQAQHRGINFANRTTERGRNIFSEPNQGKRITLAMTRGALGLGGSFTSLGILFAERTTEFARVLNPVAAGVIGVAGLYNGITVSAFAADKSFGIERIISKMASEKDEVEENIDLLALEFGGARASIALAEVLAQSGWEDPLLAGILGEKMKELLLTCTTRECKAVIRAISRISADVETSDPHLDVLEGLLHHFNSRSDLGNGSQHFGREM